MELREIFGNMVVICVMSIIGIFLFLPVLFMAFYLGIVILLFPPKF